MIDILTIGARGAAGDEFAIEEKLLLDLDGMDRPQVIQWYEDQLCSEWEDQEVLFGSTGRVWERDDQRFTIMMTEVEGTDVLVSITSVRE